MLAGWSGGANVLSQIAIGHALENGKGSDRMLLVGLGATDNFTNPEKISLTYDGVAMVPAIKVFDSASQHTLAAIYYLLDASLPDAPGSKQVVAGFGGNYTWGHGAIQVLELKNAMQVAPIATSGGAGPSSCSATMIRSGSISFNEAGSLVYGFLTARGATGTTLSASAGLTELWKQTDTSPENIAVASAYSIDDSARTMTWTVTDCFNSAVALAAIKRLNYK
jgi:hypothetical protein